MNPNSPHQIISRARGDVAIYKGDINEAGHGMNSAYKRMQLQGGDAREVTSHDQIYLASRF